MPNQLPDCILLQALKGCLDENTKKEEWFFAWGFGHHCEGADSLDSDWDSHNAISIFVGIVALLLAVLWRVWLKKAVHYNCSFLVSELAETLLFC